MKEARKKAVNGSMLGFTLLEVLIAVFVFSIGLLGLAALQVNALQSAKYSYQSTIANLIAKDVRDRLWLSLHNDGACPVDVNNILDDVNEDWSDIGWDGGEEPSGRSDIPGLSVNISAGGATDAVCGYRVEVRWENERFASSEAGEVVLDYYVGLPANMAGL